MAAALAPGFLCVTACAPMDGGTSALQRTPPPSSVGLAHGAGALPLAGRVAEAIRRAARRLPAESANVLLQLLSPQSLAVTATLLTAWAASHGVGIGEAVDVILLVGGVAFIGWQAIDGFSHLVRFVGLIVRASSDAEIDEAADHLRKAVVELGVAVVSALLLRGAGRVGRYQPTVVGDASMAAGTGWTNAFGDIRYSTAGPETEQALVLYHEKVHAFFSPKLLLLRELRADIGMAAYRRSSLLRYLEEALAESVAQLRVNGIRGLPAGIRFPIANGYVSLRAVVGEAAVATAGIGSITLGGIAYTVSLEPAAP